MHKKRLIEKLYYGSGRLQLLLCLVLLLSGCSSAQHYDSFLRENIDLSFVRTIAVLPVTNNSKDEFAPERVRDLTMTRILASQLFDVVDKGMVDGLLHQEGIDPTKPIDRPALKRLGQQLRVQAIMLGTVDFASETRHGSVVFPEITITLRLLEVDSSMIIWQASGHGSGDSLFRRIFGQANIDTFQTTRDLIDNLLVSIPMEKSK